MRKGMVAAICSLLLVASAPIWAQKQTRDITPSELRDLPRDQRMAAVQALKDAESARAGAGFQGTPQFGRVGNNDTRTVFRTVTYDTGNFSGVPNIPAIPDNFSLGNRHSSAMGNPLTALPITVTAYSVFMAAVNSSLTGTGAAFMTVFGPLNGPQTNASPVTSVNVAGLQAGSFNIHTFATPGVITAAPSFLAGVWNPTAGSTAGPTPCGNDCVGLDSSGTVNGQGFHAMAIEDLTGGNFQPIAGANALLRVSGKNVPVELMNFSVEE